MLGPAKKKHERPFVQYVESAFETVRDVDC